MRKTKVFILYTGGTIGMAPKEKGNPASPLEPKSLEELKSYMPALNKFEEKIEFGEASPFGKGLDSSDVKPKHWIKMAEEIEKVYDDYDGFVVLNGTDTMAFTASGLSFIFQNLSKPVVVTGSQLPISDVRTDAVSNFTNAIHLAGYKAFDLPRIPEVVICFADKVLRGNRASKVSSTQWVGFDSPNFPPLGKLGEHIQINTGLLRPLPTSDRLIINTDLVENIINIVIFPGFKATHLEKLIDDDKIDGVIISTFGAGNAPGDKDFLAVIDTATTKGKLILNITQCVEGMVNMGLYAASSGLLERGVVSGLDMTTEAAIAKMMWVLGNQFGKGRIRQLQINQRGEQSGNLFDLGYGAIKRDEPKNIYQEEVIPDGRLDRNRLSKAVVRISNLGLVDAKEGKTITLNVFMNKPMAKVDTPERDNKCVASFKFVWDNKPITLIDDITDKTKHVIGDGDIVLSLVSSDENIKFYFKGLYLALFSKA